MKKKPKKRGGKSEAISLTEPPHKADLAAPPVFGGKKKRTWVRDFARREKKEETDSGGQGGALMQWKGGRFNSVQDNGQRGGRRGQGVLYR